MKKRSHYFLSGAVETKLIYYYQPALGSTAAVDEGAVAIHRNGVSTFYIGKKGIIASKNKWLSLSSSEILNRFEVWKKRWNQADPELYTFSIEHHWEKNWQRLEDIQNTFWRESYCIENTDPFADEIERIVKAHLEQHGIEVSLFHDLVSPSVATLPQRLLFDLHRVKQGRYSEKDYLRKYWYCMGTWNGGKKLTSADVRKQQDALNEADISEQENMLRQRKKIHEQYDPKIDEHTKQLLTLLRVLTLWRDERKAVLQKINVCLAQVARQGSRELGVNPEIFSMIHYAELDAFKQNPELFKQRLEKNVLVIERGKSIGTVLTGSVVDLYIQEFILQKKTNLVKGTVACSGIANGRVRIIVKEHHFALFQDGEVLITTMTRPEFVPLMRKACAIVTDEGGITSHAAIVSRELKVPCIVGTKHATEVFEDGDLVQVDAEHGIVRRVS